MVVLQVIGGGRMGEALVCGLVASGTMAETDVRIVEPVPSRRDELAAVLPAVELASEPGDAQGTVIAVKPADVAGVCRAAAKAGSGRVLSIAAGVTIAAIEAQLSVGTPVVRAMPNTPATVGVGAAAIAPGTSATEADLAWAESLLDAVTGLSGSGPAYVFLVAEALIDAGVLAGLPREVSVRLAIQTLLGASTLLAQGDAGPEALRAAVTSPGGTTAAGLRVLEQHGVRAAFLEAVAAATARSKELGA